MSGATPPPRILIVEDEPLVRMLLVDQLEELGFQVEEAATAADALARFSAQRSMHAAVIDVGLPDRSGDDLVIDIRGIDPDLPILLASGYDEERIRQRLGGTPAIGYLGKPYDITQLDQLLRELGVSAPGNGSGS